MKILETALLVLSFALPVVSRSVKVMENFLRPEQLDAFRNNAQFISTRRSPSGRFQAEVALPPFLVSKVRSSFENKRLMKKNYSSDYYYEEMLSEQQQQQQQQQQQNYDEEQATTTATTTSIHNNNFVFNNQVKTIKTSLIDTTTTPHQDRYVADDSKKQASLVDDEDVGIIFLNSNSDAAFVHGDNSYPVVAGTLLSFPGTIEHNTLIKNGYVHLLGPFTMKSFASNIGGGLDPCKSTCDQRCQQQLDQCTDQCGIIGFVICASTCVTVNVACELLCQDADCRPTATPTTASPTLSFPPTLSPTSPPTSPPRERTWLEKLIDWFLRLFQ